SHDYAHFFITVAADTLPQTLPYLAELLLHAAIPADEFVRERQVVLEEILQAQDDPDWLGYQALCAQLYGEHAYGRAVLGTPEVLLDRSPEEMRQFHRAHYQPEQMTVAIAGGIDQTRAVELVQQSFTQFAEPLWCPQTAEQALPPQTFQHQTLHLPNLEQSRLTMAWSGPGVSQMETASGLDLLSTLLGGGQTARLVRELREERQLVQEIESSFSLQQGCSLLSLSMWLEAAQISEVETIVGDRIAELAEQPITPAELSRCQRLLLNDYAFSMETPGQIAGLYGYYATIAQPQLATSYPQQVRSLTPAFLQQIASQYLSPERYSAVVLQPE
ncbi:MAG: pitrilysin family protein, partial [Phormidesmis sp.]